MNVVGVLRRCVGVAVLNGLLSGTLAACGGPSITFYEVLRVRQEECTIRQNGEFCVEPEQFDPPVTEVWSVELHDDRSVLSFDEEVWLLAPLAEGEDPATATYAGEKRLVTTDGTGCTTTALRVVRFTADGAIMNGTLSSRSVLEGPAACGATPTGDRSVDAVSGTAGSP